MQAKLNENISLASARISSSCCLHETLAFLAIVAEMAKTLFNFQAFENKSFRLMSCSMFATKD